MAVGLKLAVDAIIYLGEHSSTFWTHELKRLYQDEVNIDCIIDGRADALLFDLLTRAQKEDDE